jgi:hypothetical protein
MKERKCRRQLPDPLRTESTNADRLRSTDVKRKAKGWLAGQTKGGTSDYISNMAALPCFSSGPRDGPKGYPRQQLRDSKH